MNRSATETIVGTVKRLTYWQEDTGYFVAAIELPGGDEKTVIGTAPMITPGEQLRARGRWANTAHGRQFKATDVLLVAPTQNDALVKYLSNAIDGIGPGFAQKLVDTFGSEVFQVIEHRPEELKKLKGVGKKRIDAILSAYESQKGVRDVMLFLTRCGFGPKTAKKVVDKYGSKAMARIRENPYLLAEEVRGIGFLKADEAAQKQGISKTSEYRIRAGIKYVLSKAEDQGSCGLPYGRLIEETGKMLEVDEDLVVRALDLEVLSKDVVRDRDGEGIDCCFNASIFEREKMLGEMLIAHASKPVSRPIHDVDLAIMDAEFEMRGVSLAPAQKEALRVALSSQCTVITGGPGVGKTTVTKALLHAFKEHGLTTLLAAPTGKAAQRAEEATGHPASTIHRMLQFGPNGFVHNPENPLSADVVVLDELSIVDVELAWHVLRALSPATRLVLIGDKDQLPSVGAGKVLADIIASRRDDILPVVALTTIFRQAATSRIIANAHRINQGEMPDLEYMPGSDFVFQGYDLKKDATDEEKSELTLRIQDDLVKVAANIWRRNFDPMSDLQVLAPIRKGALGTDVLNLRLQAALNPNPSATIDVRGNRWGVGDKVMQLKNNYSKNVFNGDIGFVHDVDTRAVKVFVDFSGKIVEYSVEDFSQLTLAYAITIHKSQGSEAPVILMPLHSSHYTMLKRNLLYTGVTRAKKLCVVFGTRWAIERAVASAQVEERYTRLKAWLEKPPAMTGNLVP